MISLITTLSWACATGAIEFPPQASAPTFSKPSYTIVVPYRLAPDTGEPLLTAPPFRFSVGQPFGLRAPAPKLLAQQATVRVTPKPRATEFLGAEPSLVYEPAVATPVSGQIPLPRILGANSLSDLLSPIKIKPRGPEPLFSSESFQQSNIIADQTVVSVNMVETELPVILQNISDMTKLNLVLLAGQTTKLTLHLTNVKLVDLLRHICALTGLNFLKVGGTYVVATQSQLQSGYPLEWLAANPKSALPTQNGILMQTYNCSYINGKDAVDAISSMFPAPFSVTLAPAQFSPVIANPDTASVTNVQATTVTKAGDGPRARLLVIRGTREQIDAAVGVLKIVDYPRPQVTIKVNIYDISNSALKELGASWTFGDVSIVEQATSGIGFSKFIRSPQSFSAQIKALETKNAAKTLASPNVSLLDGERAFILIGSRLSFPVLIGYSQANTPIYDKQEERVGIYLQVAVSISDDNKITLNIYPQVSTVTGFLQVNGASYPQIATREAQTTLRVGDGETIIMGGLLSDEDVKQLERVPILSDIPFFGELFKRRKTTKTTSQVIISITPTIMQASKR